MIRIRKLIALSLLILILAVSACAYANSQISTTVVMRVSKMTQSAVVNVGEDLSMEINIEGVEPSSYRWYFDGEAIPGADQKVYNIVNAQLSDSGLYRMDAFDENGRMLVSMDINARVIDNSIPRSGDSSLPAPIAAAVFVLAAGSLVLLLKRSKRA